MHFSLSCWVLAFWLTLQCVIGISTTANNTSWRCGMNIKLPRPSLPGSTSQEGVSRQAGQTNPSSDSASGKSSSEQQGSAVQFDPALEQYIFENMQGVLTIKKIDLKIPVLKEDTEENLNISVAHVAGTSGPGEVGNYVIAGHRMRAYGRHFNRLHEVTVGDEIVFTGPEGGDVQIPGV